LQAVGVGFPARSTPAAQVDVLHRRARVDDARRPAVRAPGDVFGRVLRGNGIPLLSGRTFRDRDVETAPPVAIVNASLAKKYWPGETRSESALRFDDNPADPWFHRRRPRGRLRQLD